MSEPRHHEPPKRTAAARRLRRDSTFPERILWSLLRGGLLGGFKFRRQHIVGSYVADFYCDAAGLVVELDGLSHVGRAEADDRRTEYLESLGLKVVRVTNDDVLQDVYVVGEMILREAEACKQARGNRTFAPHPASPRGGEE